MEKTFYKDEVVERVRIVRESICGTRRGAAKIFARDVLKIPYTTYREYERNIVKLEFIKLLSDRFNYRIEWILTGQDPPKKS